MEKHASWRTTCRFSKPEKDTHQKGCPHRTTCIGLWERDRYQMLMRFSILQSTGVRANKPILAAQRASDSDRKNVGRWWGIWFARRNNPDKRSSIVVSGTPQMVDFRIGRCSRGSDWGLPNSPLGHFAWHWARQCTDTSAFYIAALSISLFFLAYRQWRSRADRVVNLNTTIRPPLFWITWTRARARTRPHVRAWYMGRDHSYCRASELTDSQVSGSVYCWFLDSGRYRKNTT